MAPPREQDTHHSLSSCVVGMDIASEDPAPRRRPARGAHQVAEAPGPPWRINAQPACPGMTAAIRTTSTSRMLGSYRITTIFEYYRYSCRGLVESTVVLVLWIYGTPVLVQSMYYTTIARSCIEHTRYRYSESCSVSSDFRVAWASADHSRIGTIFNLTIHILNIIPRA